MPKKHSPSDVRHYCWYGALTEFPADKFMRAAYDEGYTAITLAFTDTEEHKFTRDPAKLADLGCFFVTAIGWKHLVTITRYPNGVAFHLSKYKWVWDLTQEILDAKAGNQSVKCWYISK